MEKQTVATLPPILSPAEVSREGRSFSAVLAQNGVSPLRRGVVKTVQVNLGKLCNQACLHCHVEAGPKRTEQMTAGTAERVLWLLERTPEVEALDLTGGAPELNANFRPLVEAARGRGLRVIDRCNLTVLSEPGQENLAEFLAAQDVEITASLPCYTAETVEAQRGRGTFARSLAGLRQLNALGYGNGRSGRVLNLVYNPLGASLPPAQAGLQATYKRELFDRFGIVFDALYALTNMPVKRFAEFLERESYLAGYMKLLAENFNPATMEGLMCRSLVSVGWDGQLYDCDFNAMLELNASGRGGGRPTVWTVESFTELAGARVIVGKHCFGCTAGAGSSCGGSLDGVSA